MNAAAQTFVGSIRVSWDSPEPWQDTARKGYLSDVDRDDLSAMCDETGDDCSEAEMQVMEAIREHVAVCSQGDL